MTETARTEHTPEAAFVLQLDPSGGSFAGRVEHVVTGQAARFGCAAELTCFVDRVLNGASVESERVAIDISSPNQRD